MRSAAAAATGEALEASAADAGGADAAPADAGSGADAAPATVAGSADPAPATTAGSAAADAAPAEAHTAAAAASLEAEPPAATEPVILEIWRPQRQYRGERHPKGGRGQDAAHPRESGRDEAGRRDHRDHRGRRGGSTERAGGGDPSLPAAAPTEGGDAPAAAATQGPGAARPDRPHGDRQRPGRFDKGGRPPRHDGERGKDRERPPRKPEPVADPDSPFAKLAALKADLEKRARER